MRALVAVALLAACHPTDHVRTTETPRLVVLIVIDQWPEWSFEAKRAALDGGGFTRLLAEGEWRIGQHPSAATLTAPGHALLGTGAPPAESGILANEWYRRDAGKRQTAVEDGDTSSARWLRVPGIADALARIHPTAKAVSVSLKDRSAILVLGRGGTPIWYDRKTASFTSPAKPPWLARQSLGARIHDVWTPLDASRLARLSAIADDARGEVGEKHFGPVFPHVPDDTGDAADAVFSQPLGNTAVFETALAAIEGEGLGTDDVPDLLVLSLSAHDYVAHGWGHESWEMWDAELRLDAELAGFLAELDRRAGAGRWAMVVTSDHGGSPQPERAPGGGGRITLEQLHTDLERAAAAVLGPGPWISDAKYPTVYLSPALLALPASRRDAGIAAVLGALRAYPGIARAELAADLVGNCAVRPPDDRALCLALDRERSGEIVFVPRPFWIMQDADEPLATAHGSLNAYDREVPVLVLRPDRRTHSPQIVPLPGRMDMRDVAPLLARWLGVVLR